MKYRQRPNNPLIVQVKLGAGHWKDYKTASSKTAAKRLVTKLSKAESNNG